jgi:hypothetical protein
MGNRSGGSVGGDANPNGDRTDDRFLRLALFLTLVIFFTLAISSTLASFFTLAIFFTLDVFVLGRFVDLDLLETNNVYRCKTDLEIPISKLYDMMDIN